MGLPIPPTPPYPSDAEKYYCVYLYWCTVGSGCTICSFMMATCQYGLDWLPLFGICQVEPGGEFINMYYNGPYDDFDECERDNLA